MITPPQLHILYSAQQLHKNYLIIHIILKSDLVAHSLCSNPTALNLAPVKSNIC